MTYAEFQYLGLIVFVIAVAGFAVFKMEMQIKRNKKERADKEDRGL